jgi:hypothetical protein
LGSRKRRRHKQRRRQEGRSRINIPSCHIRHSQWGHEINGRFGSRSFPVTKHDGPKNQDGSKNHGPKLSATRRSANRAVLRQDQSGSGDVAYEPRKPRQAPQCPPKTYPRLRICHGFGSGMPIGDEFCPFDENGRRGSERR